MKKVPPIGEYPSCGLPCGALRSLWRETELGDKREALSPRLGAPASFEHLVWSKGLRHIPFLIEYREWFLNRLKETISTPGCRSPGPLYFHSGFCCR